MIYLHRMFTSVAKIVFGARWHRGFSVARPSAYLGKLTHPARHATASVDGTGGWSDIAMVQRYAHLNPDHLRAHVERCTKLTQSGEEDEEDKESHLQMASST